MASCPPTSGTTTRMVIYLRVIIILFGCLRAAAVTDPKETQALLAFRAKLGDPNFNLKSWTDGTDPCETPWAGVICNPGDFPASLYGTNFSYVTELRLLGMNLGGPLVDELGDLQALKHLDVMWNRMNGSIPAAIGRLANLNHLLLTSNSFGGVLPPELGQLQNLTHMQVDENHISGPVPSTFSQLRSVRHFHMNNNSLNGTLPEGLGSLPELMHFLLDNNQLTGPLPADLVEAPKLLIIQLDNNRISSGIPASYAGIPTLLKLSLRNCSMQGSIPDFTKSVSLVVLDLSYNQFTGSIPTAALPSTLSMIDLSFNQLHGPVPDNVGELQNLKFLEVRDNQLSGAIPVNLGTGSSFSGNQSGDLILDFQNNSLVLPVGSNLAKLQSQSIADVWLSGNALACPLGGPINPLCISNTVNGFLGTNAPKRPLFGIASTLCSACQSPTVVVPTEEPNSCRCAVPITVGFRLKSPIFSVFQFSTVQFKVYITGSIDLSPDQVQIAEIQYEPGPRIVISILLFPVGRDFNETEITRLYNIFAIYLIPIDSTFGPYEVLYFTFPKDATNSRHKSLRLPVGAWIAILLPALGSLPTIAALILLRRRAADYQENGQNPGSGPSPTFKSRRSRRKSLQMIRRTIQVAGAKTFTFQEIVKATASFHETNILGQGGYGKVYLGILEDGRKVAIKRAQEGSLQGAKEFETEILLLSRVHHRNLVCLIGYCNDEDEQDSDGEQLLVYEFIPNGNLRQHLKNPGNNSMSLPTRLRIALGSARGISYLHNQAEPPIFHRDIKAANILLDGQYNAKVADFGLSKLASSTEATFDGVNAGHISTMVKGTPGYLDPEYYLTHKLTDKSDVYSFGVVMLELITGLPPIFRGKNLIREIGSALRAGQLGEVADVGMGMCPMEVVDPFIKLGLACCHDDTRCRPSMAEVVYELEAIWKEAPWSDVSSHNFAQEFSGPLLQLREGELSSSKYFSSPFGRSSAIESGAQSDPSISETEVDISPR